MNNSTSSSKSLKKSGTSSLSSSANAKIPKESRYFSVAPGELCLRLNCAPLPAADILCGVDEDEVDHKHFNNSNSSSTDGGKQRQRNNSNGSSNTTSSAEGSQMIAIPPDMQDAMSLPPLMDANLQSHLQQERDSHPLLSVDRRPRLDGLALHNITSRALDAVGLLRGIGCAARYTTLDTTLAKFATSTLPKMDRGDALPLVDVHFPAPLVMGGERETISSGNALDLEAHPSHLIAVSEDDMVFGHLCGPWFSPEQPADSTPTHNIPRQNHLCNVNYGQSCPFTDVPIAIVTSAIATAPMIEDASRTGAAVPTSAEALGVVREDDGCATIGTNMLTAVCPFFSAYGFCTISNCPHAHLCFDNKTKEWMCIPLSLNVRYSRTVCCDLIRGDREGAMKRQRLFYHSYQQKIADLGRKGFNVSPIGGLIPKNPQQPGGSGSQQLSNSQNSKSTDGKQQQQPQQAPHQQTQQPQQMPMMFQQPPQQGQQPGQQQYMMVPVPIPQQQGGTAMDPMQLQQQQMLFFQQQQMMMYAQQQQQQAMFMPQQQQFGGMAPPPAYNGKQPKNNQRKHSNGSQQLSSSGNNGSYFNDSATKSASMSQASTIGPQGAQSLQWTSESPSVSQSFGSNMNRFNATCAPAVGPQGNNLGPSSSVTSATLMTMGVAPQQQQQQHQPSTPLLFKQQQQQ